MLAEHSAATAPGPEINLFRKPAPVISGGRSRILIGGSCFFLYGVSEVQPLLRTESGNAWESQN